MPHPGITLSSAYLKTSNLSLLLYELLQRVAEMFNMCVCYCVAYYLNTPSVLKLNIEFVSIAT